MPVSAELEVLNKTLNPSEKASSENAEDMSIQISDFAYILKTCHGKFKYV